MSEIYLGAHHRVDSIFVYDVQLHNKLIPSASKKVHHFKYSLVDLLKKSIYNQWHTISKVNIKTKMFISI